MTVNWEELESPKDAREASKGDIVTEVVVAGASRRISAIEHWKRNLERFPKDHIGHRYALEALAHLTRFDKEEDL